MGHLAKKVLLLSVIATAVLMPMHVHASGVPSVPEPVSLALVATGLAGLGVTALIRRRKDK